MSKPAFPAFLAARFEGPSFMAQGAVTCVWRARDAGRGASVAIKQTLRPIPPAAAAHLAAEAEQLKTAPASRVVRLLEAGLSPEGFGYALTDLGAGQSLAKVLREGARDWREAFRTITKLAGGLEALHALGLVHRKLHPGNVLVSGPDGPLILDAGLWPFRLGADGRQALAPGYAAPEQARGEPAIPASDVFGLGAILHHLLLGSAPLGEAGPAGWRRRAAAGEEVDLRALEGTLPDAELATLKRALAPDPAARYRDGAELAAALRRLADEEEEGDAEDPLAALMMDDSSEAVPVASPASPPARVPSAPISLEPAASAAGDDEDDDVLAGLMGDLDSGEYETTSAPAPTPPRPTPPPSTPTASSSPASTSTSPVDVPRPPSPVDVPRPPSPVDVSRPSSPVDDSRPSTPVDDGDGDAASPVAAELPTEVREVIRALPGWLSAYGMWLSGGLGIMVLVVFVLLAHRAGPKARSPAATAPSRLAGLVEAVADGLEAAGPAAGSLAGKLAGATKASEVLAAWPGDLAGAIEAWDRVLPLRKDLTRESPELVPTLGQAGQRLAEANARLLSKDLPAAFAHAARPPPDGTEGAARRALERVEELGVARARALRELAAADAELAPGIAEARGTAALVQHVAGSRPALLDGFLRKGAADGSEAYLEALAAVAALDSRRAAGTLLGRLLDLRILVGWPLALLEPEAAIRQPAPRAGEVSPRALAFALAAATRAQVRGLLGTAEASSLRRAAGALQPGVPATGDGFGLAWSRLALEVYVVSGHDEVATKVTEEWARRVQGRVEEGTYAALLVTRLLDLHGREADSGLERLRGDHVEGGAALAALAPWPGLKTRLLGFLPDLRKGASPGGTSGGTPVAARPRPRPTSSTPTSRRPVKPDPANAEKYSRFRRRRRRRE